MSSFFVANSSSVFKLDGLLNNIPGLNKNSWLNIFLLIIGIIMSLHYGVIFNITGQIFFAALMSNKINLKLKWNI